MKALGQVFVAALVLTSGVAHARHPGASRLIYMNRFGGEYYDGWPDDSRMNRASALAVDRAVLPAYPYDDTWGELVECVRDVFADFDVYVTEEDPGDLEHIEVVVGGSGEDIGHPEAGGIAPGTCSVLENAVVFVFAGDSTDLDRLCWTAGQEAGHAYGLDHVTFCDDIMTYDFTCASKDFTDVDAYCGEYVSRPCRCGGDTQNSHQLLLERLGPHPANAPPTVSIVAPADGAVVGPGFAIDVEATDDFGVDYVRLEIDGENVDTDGLEPWGFVAPADLANGTHSIAVQAVDYDGDSGSDAITVTLSGSDACPEPPCDPDAGSAGDGGDAPRHRAYGCGCGATPGPVAASFWIALALYVMSTRKIRFASDR